MCGRNESFSNQVLSALEWTGSTLTLTHTNLRHPTLERDASHPYLISICALMHTMHSFDWAQHFELEGGRWGFHTHYGTPFLRPSAYKVRVRGVSSRCGIE